MIWLLAQETIDDIGLGLSGSLPYGLAAAIVAIIGRVVLQVFKMGMESNQRADATSERTVNEYKQQLTQIRDDRKAERSRWATDRKAERDAWAIDRTNLEKRIAEVEQRLAEQTALQAAFAQERAQWTIEKAAHQQERERWATERQQMEDRIRHLEELIEPDNPKGEPTP